jgi:putative spermidine/putrescine transport system ATP-binding protein
VRGRARRRVSTPPPPPNQTVAKPPPLGTAPLGLDNDLPGTVEFVSYLGAVLDLRVRLSDTERVTVQMANRQDGMAPAVGARVHVGWSADAGRIFTQDAGAAA